MEKKIALGFHICIDYELVWNYESFKDLIITHSIKDSEIVGKTSVTNFRDLLIACLAYMKEGTGGEIIPSLPELCNEFAEHFSNKITLGGTATRAAIAISKLGYSSILHGCLDNKHVRELLPSTIQYLPSVDYSETIYPHVIIQYPKNQVVQINDITFTTRKANRIMISNDAFSSHMQILPKFSSMIQKAPVLLLSCYSQVMDKNSLDSCLNKTKQILADLPEDVLVIFEDGCYGIRDFRFYVHKELCSFIDVISMNEDEMQDYIGKKINIMDAGEVAKAIEYIQQNIGIPNVLVHTGAWAVAYGRDNEKLKKSLQSGIALASTRFQWGDNFGIKEFEETQKYPLEEPGVDFCNALKNILGNKVSCAASYDLDFVKTPTVVGLGDFFAGGLLPGLVENNT